jgi:glutaminase
VSGLSILQGVVERVYKTHLPNTAGEVAQYIPELAQADPDPFGIVVVSVDKGVVAVGDVDTPFTIQSISKPFVFGFALDLLGAERTYGLVGTEPSGEAFNSIEMNPLTQRPFNPMVNAGAIAMSSLLHDHFGDDTEREILQLFGRLAGEPVDVNEKVFSSELATADRNRALAYLMKSVGAVNAPVEEKLSLYTKQCSINVTARQLATMAATLANIGTNPVTGEMVFSPLTVRNILSVMFTCGMYDFAGRWAVDVGIPAKSGVSGGVMAVINRQVGIGIFSPRLDEHGNSVRAIAACIDLAEELGLHNFEFSNVGSSVLGVYFNQS